MVLYLILLLRKFEGSETWDMVSSIICTYKSRGIKVLS